MRRTAIIRSDTLLPLAGCGGTQATQPEGGPPTDEHVGDDNWPWRSGAGRRRLRHSVRRHDDPGTRPAAAAAPI